MDMQFGDVEEAGPDVQLRPDQNRHYAVVPVHSPEDADLPIFVDIDVMRDMESHALTDTSVELGGVMLGGQFEDDEGNAFVLVTDSLRAEHYEATKGSFKFTHETWQQISRQRDEFPKELQMVGWYHTHPDWGVFLSGMDMFICDNFFNRPLDLALVIDPCRGDRGWFHWEPAAKDRIRRTGGFYLIGSRFRQSEIEYFAHQLKGKLGMSPEFRNSGIAGSIGPQSAPIVNISDSRNSNLNLGIMALLTMQFFFLMLISWKLLFSGPDASQLADVTKKVEDLVDSKNYAEKVEVMQLALKAAGDGKAELAIALGNNLELAKRAEDANVNRDVMKTALSKALAKSKKSTSELKKAEAELEIKSKTLKTTNAKLKSLKESGEGGISFFQDGLVITIFVVAVFVTGIGAGIAGFLFGRFRDEEQGEIFDRERETISRSSSTNTEPTTNESEAESEPAAEPFEIRDEESKDSTDKRE